MEYILKRGALTATADSHGGELVSFRDGSSTEYIWQGNPAYWSGRNPNLFPIVGGLKGGTVLINGAPHRMNRHGFARNSEFSVVDRGEDYIVFQLMESDATLQAFPFCFRLRIRHQLLQNGFSTEFEITNTGEDVLPFCIGAHTAFNCPMGRDERFEEYRLVFDQPEDASALFPDSTGCLNRTNLEYTLQNTDTIWLDHQTFERVDTLIFENLNSSGISLLNAGGHGVRMDFSQFPMIAFWTNGAKKAPYICLEPWHGCAAFTDESGEFQDKPHCILLLAGQTKVLGYTVTVI